MPSYLQRSPSGPFVAGFSLVDSRGVALPISLDAFARLRVSSPSSLFDSKQCWSQQTELFDHLVAGAGSQTYQYQRASTLLRTGGVGRALRRSRRYLNYQPGKGQLVFATFIAPNGPVAGSTKRVGYFDDSDGLFFMLDATGFAAVKRSSVTGVIVDSVVRQADWNYDTMDGTGPSGVTLDPTQNQIAYFAFEWLGVGSVEFGFVVDGAPMPVHRLLNANAGSAVYMRTPSLPVSYEIEGTVDDTLEAICCSVMSEGGQDVVGTQVTVDRDGVAINNATTLRPIISVRLAAGRNDTIFPSEVSALCTAPNVNSYWALFARPTITGGAAPVWVTQGPLEYDITRDGVVSLGSGIKIASGYFSSQQRSGVGSIQQLAALGRYADGTADEMVLAAGTLSVAADFYGSLKLVRLS